MPQARVLDVGNCMPDHYNLRRMLERHFDVAVDRVMFIDEATERLESDAFQLVLVNRLIFEDQSEGVALVHAMRGNGLAPATPVMMISNFEDAQEAAVTAGAVRGFGKASINDPETLDRLAHYLPRKAVPR